MSVLRRQAPPCALNPIREMNSLAKILRLLFVQAGGGVGETALFVKRAKYFSIYVYMETEELLYFLF